MLTLGTDFMPGLLWKALIHVVSFNLSDRLMSQLITCLANVLESWNTENVCMTILAFTCVRIYGFQNISTSITLLNAISFQTRKQEKPWLFFWQVSFSLMTISFPLSRGLGDVSRGATLLCHPSGTHGWACYQPDFSEVASPGSLSFHR